MLPVLTPPLERKPVPSSSRRVEGRGGSSDLEDGYPFPVTSPLMDGERSAQGRRSVDSPEEDGDDGREPWDGVTALDDTLEKIGMGKYQTRLLVLCGFGWMADNMWLQCVAVILPRVQQHFDVSDRWIGLLSSSIFVGMLIGAWGWGSYSDAKGRSPAFHLTLLLTSGFGCLAIFAPTFPLLCLALLCLGTGVGGSMPTDGTLFLENIPKTYHYLLTALSAFFSVGAVLTSILGLIIIPRYSCSDSDAKEGLCDPAKGNNGWRYMLAALTIISLMMALLRILFFKLQESAKFLVSAGRPSEAIIALQRISRMNGKPMVWGLEDVLDRDPNENLGDLDEDIGRSEEQEGENVIGGKRNGVVYGTPSPGSVRPGTRFASIDQGSRNDSGEEEEEGGGRGGGWEDDSPIDVEGVFKPRTRTWKKMEQEPSESKDGGRGWTEKLPVGMHAGVEDYMARIDALFEVRWARVTKLVWVVWFFASAGYTIFNVFLPKYLEKKVGSDPQGGGLEQSLKDYVFYTVSGFPGSLVGAYLVESSLGRVGTMAASTCATTLATLVFVFVSSQSGVVISGMVCSFAATLMYAVIYSYTPEAFPPAMRGTAVGIASALSRLAGMGAPILTGLLLSINVTLPLLVSAFCFALTTGAMLLLPETRGGPKVSAVGH